MADGDGSSGVAGRLVLTGFGPFAGHDVNASWEAVRAVRDGGLWKHARYELTVEEIPVSYSFVASEVPGRWQGAGSAGEPPVSAVVHVGVSRLAGKLTLETVAHNEGYDREDVDKRCPEGGRCVPCGGGGDRLTTAFDVPALVARVNAGFPDTGVECEASEDAGRYLCEFSFFKSMHATGGRALFVHVPELDKPYSASQLASAICLVLDGIAEWLDNSKE